MRLRRLLCWYEWRAFFNTPKIWYQRIRYGYSDRDLWSLDHYLAFILKDALRDLADTTHGWPGRPPEPFWVEMTPEQQAEFPFETFEQWKDWLKDKAEWFDWYWRDDDGIEGDTNWIDDNLSEEERKRRIDVHIAKMTRFQKEVLPDFIKHFSGLWD